MGIVAVGARHVTRRVEDVFGGIVDTHRGLDIIDRKVALMMRPQDSQHLKSQMLAG